MTGTISTFRFSSSGTTESHISHTDSVSLLDKESDAFRGTRRLLFTRMHQFSKNRWANSKFQAPSGVIWSHFHCEEPQILDSTAQNSVPWTTWLDGFVHPWIPVFTITGHCTPPWATDPDKLKLLPHTPSFKIDCIINLPLTCSSLVCYFLFTSSFWNSAWIFHFFVYAAFTAHPSFFDVITLITRVI